MKRKNEKGVALIAAVMVVAILAGIGISFSFNMRLEERAAANYLWKTQADAIAQGGIERTIQTLINRRNEQFTHLGNYSIAVLNVGLGGGLTARSEIAVRDEAGKVNLNTSGHPEVLSPGTGFARPGTDRGWTTAEVKLPPIGISDAVWGRKFGANNQEGASGIDDNRFLADGVTINPFGANSVLASDRIDNDGDGLVDETNEGIDEHSEFVFLRGGRTTLDFTHDDRPFITVGETEVEGVELSLYTTLYSRDRHTEHDRWFSAAGVERGKTNINADISTAALRTTFLRSVRDTLLDSGFLAADAEQIAVNTIDFRDADSNPTQTTFPSPGTGITRIGIERTLFLNEIREHEYWSWQWRHEVDKIELHNPWNTPVSGRYTVVWRDHSGDNRTIFNAGITIAAADNNDLDHREFRLFYHDPPSDPESGGSITLWRCAAGNGTDWHRIETVTIGWTSFTSFHAKDDPRVPSFAYVGLNHSLGRRNDEPNLQNFRPRAGGEVPVVTHWAGHFNHWNRNFHNTGELGLIHTGRQWGTLAMRNIDIDGNGTVDRPHQGALLNRVTIGHPYNRLGRININTASRDVLTSLPQMFQGHQAEGILAARPFNTIGDAVPHLTAVVGAKATIDVLITQLMQWIQNVANWAVHWPSTWGWPLGGIGDSLHNWMLGELANFLNQPPMYSRTDTNPHNDQPIVRNPPPDPGANPPTYLNFFANPLTISIVRGISKNVVNVTQSIINWARNNVPNWFGWRESLINAHLNPIIRAGNTAYNYTIAGDDLDGDGFMGEDDELETIVRSVSNLITTRSDRFEIVSIGSILRGGELLAESRMRVIVCRITNPVEILHFERR